MPHGGDAARRGRGRGVQASSGAGDLCFAPQGLVRLGAPEMLGSNGSVMSRADRSDPSITAQWQSGTTWVIRAAFRDTVAAGGREHVERSVDGVLLMGGVDPSRRSAGRVGSCPRARPDHDLSAATLSAIR